LLKTIEDINATKKRVRIEIPAEVLENEILSSLEKLKQKVKIPGFRPGKAPVTLIEKRFGKDVEAEVLEKIIPEYYNNALKEASLSPVAMPMLEEKFEFKRNTPLNLSFVIEVLPKIEKLNYENIAIKDIPFSVEESDVDDMIKRVQNQKAVFEIADKDVEKDDFVSFEYVDSEIEGEAVDPSLKERISKMGNELFPADIMDKVLGKKKGDIVEFTALPDASKFSEIAGKTLNVKVRITEVKKKTLPDIDDEFAKDLGFENIADLREKLKERISAAKKEHVQKIQKAEIIKKIIESDNFDVPETLVNRELESLMMDKSLSEEKDDTVYSDTMSDVMQNVSEGEAAEKAETAAQDLQADMKQRAVRNVQASVIIDAIGQKEGVTVSDTELDERISHIAKRLSASPEAVRNFYTYKQGSLDGLKQSILEEKVLDILLSRAVVEKGESA
jgi:trigger factor